MTRHVMERQRDFMLADKPRHRGFEGVVALVGIERSQLAAEHGLVVGHDGDAALDVIEDVHLAAKVRVPPELVRVVARDEVRFELKVIAREELEMIDGTVERLWTGLLREGGD